MWKHMWKHLLLEILSLRIVASSLFPGFTYSDRFSRAASCHPKVTMSMTMMVMLLMLMMMVNHHICIILYHLQICRMAGRERKTYRCREEEQGRDTLKTTETSNGRKILRPTARLGPEHMPWDFFKINSKMDSESQKRMEPQAMKYSRFDARSCKHSNFLESILDLLYHYFSSPVMLSGNEILCLPPRSPRSLIPLHQLTPALVMFVLFCWTVSLGKGIRFSWWWQNSPMWCLSPSWSSSHRGGTEDHTGATSAPCLHLCGFYHLGSQWRWLCPRAGLEVGLNINAFVILIDLQLQILIYYSFWSSAQKFNLVKRWLYISIPKVTQFLVHGGKYCRNL